jgi:hypothetical protein
VRQHGIVVFDNRSGFPKGFADLLSSLVTGSGDSKRELHTTDGEYAFKVKRPVIVNGINIPSDRADLLSRFVALEVPPISAEERLPESRFWEEFEEERGQALGRVTLSTSVGGHLRRQPGKQTSESLGAVALQGEEVLELVYDALDELPLASGPPPGLLRPRSPGVLLRGSSTNPPPNCSNQAR